MGPWWPLVANIVLGGISHSALRHAPKLHSTPIPIPTHSICTIAPHINRIKNGRMGNRMSFRPSPHVEFSVTPIDDMELVVPLEIPDSLPHESLEASNWKTLRSFVPLLKVLPALSMQQNEYVGFKFLTLITLRLSSNL